MNNFKETCHKIASGLEWLIGFAFFICLFLGGLGFVGYVVAFCIGGETATNICLWVYKTFYPVLIKIGTITTIACFVMLYLKGKANWVNPVKYWKNRKAE